MDGMARDQAPEDPLNVDGLDGEGKDGEDVEEHLGGGN